MTLEQMCDSLFNNPSVSNELCYSLINLLHAGQELNNCIKIGTNVAGTKELAFIPAEKNEECIAALNAWNQALKETK